MVSSRIHRKSAKQIAQELLKVQEAMVMKMPYKHGALSSAATARKSSCSANGSAMVLAEDRAGGRKPDESFDRQYVDLLHRWVLPKCSALVDVKPFSLSLLLCVSVTTECNYVTSW